jgi:hypothetical protein
MPDEPELDTFDPDFLGDDDVAQQAVKRLSDRLFRRALMIIDRRLSEAGMEQHSSSVIETVLGRLFSVDELRRLAEKYKAELGRTWDRFVLQQVHWGVQTELRRLRRQAVAVTEIADGVDVGGTEKPVVATDLPSGIADKVAQLPTGQRAVWTLRVAPTFDPRDSDRNVMAEFSRTTRAWIDSEVLRLVAEVLGREIDRETALDLTLKLAKLRRALARREFARKALTGLGVSVVVLHSLERAAERDGWTAEQARTAWADHVPPLEGEALKLAGAFEEFAVAIQQVRKLTEVVRSSQEQLRVGSQDFVVDHLEISTTLGVTKSNSQQLFSRANAALGLRRARAE